MLSSIRKNNQFVKGNTGFTLIEVLIAMVIFSIGILGVAALQSGSIRGNTSARGVTDIALIATDRLEMLRSLPYNDPALAAGNYVLNQATDRVDNNYDGQIDETVPARRNRTAHDSIYGDNRLAHPKNQNRGGDGHPCGGFREKTSYHAADHSLDHIAFEDTS